MQKLNKEKSNWWGEEYSFFGDFYVKGDNSIEGFLSSKKLNLAQRTKNEIRQLKTGGKLFISDIYDSKTKRINGKWIITEPDGRKIEKNYSVRVYEKDEFISLCLLVGFKNCKAFGDWSGKKYDEKSEEIIFIAEK